LNKFIVNGGCSLKGEIKIGGAKNAAVAILPATVVSDGPCIIENIPMVSDVAAIVEILRELGARIERVNGHTLMIDPTSINKYEVPVELSRNMRATYYFLGALISRFRTSKVSLPGGDDLGPRPIDQHLKAFEALGYEWSVEYGIVNLNYKGQYKGSRVFFDVVSVGATINAMLAAVKSDGLTVLENVAREPHIVDVANFLNSMGADIIGAGTNVIKIRGVKSLRGTNYSIVPDQIEAGTYMAMSVATKGNIVLKNIIPKHLESIIYKIRQIGADINIGDDYLQVSMEGDIRPTNIKTMPHPGFPTDMQPQMTAVLSKAKGTSIVTEEIWGSRFKYIDELKRMGAKIQVDGKVAVIEGTEKLYGASVKVSDIRAGAALLIAAMTCDGITEIEDTYHIDRGYEDIVPKLNELGASISIE